MSISVMTEVWQLNLPQNEKLVLLAFADHSDDDGVCFPSHKRVAWKTCISGRTVTRIVKKLEARGILRVLRPATGPGKASVYRVIPAKGDRLSPIVSGRQSVQERVTDATGKGDTAVSTQPSGTVTQPSLLGDEEEESPPDTRAETFLRMWKLGPRGSKKDARKQFMDAVPKKVRESVIEQAWGMMVASCSSMMFVPHMFRWIRSERWDEVLPPDEPEDEQFDAMAEVQRISDGTYD